MTNIVLAITEMSVGEALVTAGLGIVVVMAVLALLAVIIAIMSKIVARISQEDNAPAKAEPAAPAPAPKPQEPPKPQGKPIPVTQSRGECDLTTVDDKDAAMIMAIVADQMNEPLNTLRFISIRPID